jgi:hypothetical protein
MLLSQLRAAASASQEATVIISDLIEFHSISVDQHVRELAHAREGHGSQILVLHWLGLDLGTLTAMRTCAACTGGRCIFRRRDRISFTACGAWRRQPHHKMHCRSLVVESALRQKALILQLLAMQNYPARASQHQSSSCSTMQTMRFMRFMREVFILHIETNESNSDRNTRDEKHVRSRG